MLACLVAAENGREFVSQLRTLRACLFPDLFAVLSSGEKGCRKQQEEQEAEGLFPPWWICVWPRRWAGRYPFSILLPLLPSQKVSTQWSHTDRLSFLFFLFLIFGLWIEEYLLKFTIKHLDVLCSDRSFLYTHQGYPKPKRKEWIPAAAMLRRIIHHNHSDSNVEDKWCLYYCSGVLKSTPPCKETSSCS